ncbi:MAG: hypothetical protein Q8N36_06475, partial [bacterium]|nr:hypothetical protein [bacterium]
VYDDLATKASANNRATAPNVVHQAVTALVGLGYREAEVQVRAEEAFAVLGSSGNVEEVLRLVLRQLAARR